MKNPIIFILTTSLIINAQTGSTSYGDNFGDREDYNSAFKMCKPNCKIWIYAVLKIILQMITVDLVITLYI